MEVRENAVWLLFSQQQCFVVPTKFLVVLTQLINWHKIVGASNIWLISLQSTQNFVCISKDLVVSTTYFRVFKNNKNVISMLLIDAL